MSLTAHGDVKPPSENHFHNHYRAPPNPHHHDAQGTVAEGSPPSAGANRYGRRPVETLDGLAAEMHRALNEQAWRIANLFVWFSFVLVALAFIVGRFA